MLELEKLECATFGPRVRWVGAFGNFVDCRLLFPARPPLHVRHHCASSCSHEQQLILFHAFFKKLHVNKLCEYLPR